MSVNTSLHEWGYCKEPAQDFIPGMLGELNAMLEESKTSSDAQEKWGKKWEAWMADGDKILDAIHLLISQQIMDDTTICSPAMRNLWNHITDVVFAATYMISAVEARVDMVLYHGLPSTVPAV